MVDQRSVPSDTLSRVKIVSVTEKQGACTHSFAKQLVLHVNLMGFFLSRGIPLSSRRRCRLLV